MLAERLNLPSGLISELHRAVLRFDYRRTGPGFISEPSNSEPAGIHCNITVYQLCGFERADPIIFFLLISVHRLPQPFLFVQQRF